MADGASEWIRDLRLELFAKVEYQKANIFVMDWSNGSMTGFAYYNRAVQNIPSTGQKLTDIFRGLLRYFTVSDEGRLVNVHCIGHSLGSHVCGAFGKLMQQTAGVSISSGISIENDD